LGTSVHAVVEHLAHLEENGNKVTEKVAFELLDKEWIANSFKSETEANQAKEKAREMLKTYLSWKDANPNTVVSAEQKFTITIGGIPIKGSIDRVEKTPQGEYEVIDFKTGSVSESNNSIKDNTQMNIYAIATEMLYQKPPKKTSLFYLKKNKIISNNIEPSPLEEFRRTMENKVNLILQEEFNATPSFEACRSCDYQNICDKKKIR
jgi:ATP-dependent DNA helicase UvrD/PcrA